MILDDIAANKREKIAEQEKNGYFLHIREELESRMPVSDRPFEKALARKGMSFICEVKRASPSRGIISREFPYLDIAGDYETAGADAISCLTERRWFRGSPQYLRDIASSVSLPVLYKDFVIDRRQIEEAAAIGASAVLLICALLTDEELLEFRQTADQLGLSVLTEAHDEEEVRRAVSSGSRIIGVNNRDLNDFTVDIGNAERLARSVPDDVLFVAESGITDRDAVRRMEAAGADAVLIGEMLMKSTDRGKTLRELKGIHDKDQTLRTDQKRRHTICE